ncbi:DUF1146 family protein [Mangrovibacillus cuniculi]|uniref:DUF1146 domain-containing protein n=1 Tax=Mangrovibacillus cuniculi TaxID=2593652 RepID=A0A7S8CCY5_9BACI|nr:DUF1146 family protein [Mangrovibacillus cuniculi]QPC47700.1 DUF1146 domain-containing protein [Mangrovibacillus cuniculi]
MADFGSQALISMMVHLAFFAVTFWSLQALHFDKFLRGNKVVQARLLYILLTIAIGSAVSRFFLDYFLWSKQLPYLFN